MNILYQIARKRLNQILALILAFSSVFHSAEAEEAYDYDLVIYGGTSAAVTAAVQAKKMGLRVVIVSPDKRLGGLSSGGLGRTDAGDPRVIGGLSREFYERLFQYYQKDENWKFQKRSEFKGKQQASVEATDMAVLFEPKAALKIFEDYIEEFDIPVFKDEWLNRESGVRKDGTEIISIKTLSGKVFKGKHFMDTTYEGDLLASAGVSYHIGRESLDTYGENWNGVQTGVLHHRHHFGIIDKPISPYVIPGDPSSGVLPRISTDHPGIKGEEDNRVQAYCFRMCLTNVPENRIPFPKPNGYDPTQYELLVRIYDAGWRETFGRFDAVQNGKTDTNNHGPFSFDNIGYNYDYPEASYERRKEIIEEHKTYQLGMLYFICHDPRVPKETQEEMRKWGLPKDEYMDTENWSPQLYIREARRMVGEFVMTENELQKRVETPDSVGMGSYGIDSHNVQRYITPEGYVQNEGDIGVSIAGGPYKIAYKSLLPKAEECTNLTVPVCVSSSHIAFGSIRMEPVFMLLGQSAATASALAIQKATTLHDLDYQVLRERLEKDGQVLNFEELPPGGRKLSEFTGIVKDDFRHFDFEGKWKFSRGTGGGDFLGQGYYYSDLTEDASSQRVTVSLEAPEAGDYSLGMSYSAGSSRSKLVPVSISTANKTLDTVVDQTLRADSFFKQIAKLTLGEGETVKVTVTRPEDGKHTIVDGFQLMKTN